MELIKKYRSIILIGLFFGILYSLISLVNHYLFKTYALDLGLYTNAMYKYAHFQMADSEMIKDFSEPILGGHFDLYLLIFSPLIYLFGTYTLLIVQLIAVLLGGVGIYKFFKLIDSPYKSLPILAAVYFYSFYGVFGALSFDYHSVVVASCIIPWFFIAVYKQQKWTTVILLLFMLFAQENVSLWLIFVCIGLAIEFRKKRKIALNLLMLSGVSLLYFILVVFVVIPSFSKTEEYTGFLYSALGNTPLEAIEMLFLHPIDSFTMLFTNHNNTINGDFIKAELHWILVFTGLPFLLKKPQFILMLIPIYFQKLFHDNYMMWGIGNHYNMEFTPILTIGVFLVISSFKNIKLMKFSSILVVILSFATTIRTMDNTINYSDKTRLRFYKEEHYVRNYDVKAAHKELRKIPKDASVSAQSPYVPHLSLRNEIYQFPLIKDAEFIVLSRNESPYPFLTYEAYDLEVLKYKDSESWEVFSEGEITILKRVGE